MNLTIPYIKMHGLGNSFAIFDARTKNLPCCATSLPGLMKAQNLQVADQTLILQPAKPKGASQPVDAYMTIINADGSIASACGNGLRCVAYLLMQEHGTNQVTVATQEGIYSCTGNGTIITVDMGTPKFDWQDIPLKSRQPQPFHLACVPKDFPPCVAVNVGNPHVVFFVSKKQQDQLATLGPVIEHDALFPLRVNVSFACLQTKNSVTLRVWERGAGLTQACGTAACATVVAAIQYKNAARDVTVHLPGGTLAISWHAQITMQGTVHFEGHAKFEYLKAS